MKKLLPITAALMIISPAWANEANIEAKAEHYMNKIDANNDSQISKEEHENFGDQMFEEADSNNDNMISLSELTVQKRSEKEEMKNMNSNTKENSTTQN